MFISQDFHVLVQAIAWKLWFWENKRQSFHAHFSLRKDICFSSTIEVLLQTVIVDCLLVCHHTPAIDLPLSIL